MGNNRTLSFAAHISTILWRSAPIGRPRASSTAGLLVGVFLALAITSGRSDDSGIVIYTTLDHGRDETAIAVPFVKAERFTLVTNITTADGKVLRVTNNQMKQIVQPPDLSKSTVVDEAGIAAIRQRLAAFQALQLKFPRARSQLDPVVNELGRIIQLFEGGNALVTGRLVSRDDYERQAATRAHVVNLNVNGVTFTGARLRSVTGEKISIMHSGGVASVTIRQLSDDQIARLNGTSSGPIIERPVAVVTPAPTAVSAAAPITPPLPGTRSAEITEPPVVAEAPIKTAAASAVPTTPSVTAPVMSEPSTGLVPLQPLPSTSGSSGPIGPSGSPESLLALLRSCRSDLVMVDQGSADLNALYNVPDARYGEMTLGEAEREADRQNSVRNIAASGQEQLMQRLQTLRKELDRTPGLPEDLRKRIATLARTKQIAPRVGYGVVLLVREVDDLIKTLEGIFQSASPTLAPEADQQEKVSTPPISSVPAAPPAAIKQTRTLSPVVIGVLLLLLFVGTTFLTIHVTNRIRGSGLASTPHSSTPARPHSKVRVSQKTAAGIPGWLWPTVGGVGAALLVGGLLVFVTRESPHDFHGVGLDDAEGRFQRGLALRDGVGVDADPVEALRWFRLAADQEHAQAQFVYGDALAIGVAGAPDNASAFQWFRRAADQGHLEATMRLAFCYILGLGTEKDSKEGLRLMIIAGERGLVSAQKTLSSMYQLGEGVEIDGAACFKWTRLAAESGDPESLFGLGVHYLRGFGVAADVPEGWALIKRSSEAGFQPALDVLKEKERNESLVLEWQQSTTHQMEANRPQRPLGGNPFYSHPTTGDSSPRFRAAEQRAYDALRQQGYSDEVLRQRGFR